MTDDRVRLIAFYLPQYHPIPENDAWWGKGFTDWTSVVQARPLFPGHYQPHLAGELGFYDLRLPEVRQAQADLAREHGIHGFCYYHYWFDGRLLLNRPFDEVLASGEPDFPFCLCWANENWTRAWDGLDQHILIEQKYSPADDRRHIRWLIDAFQDKRYIRVDGKALFLVYRASKLPNSLETTSVWREEARKAGVGELYLCRVESLTDERGDPTRIGFDAAVEFQPDWACLGPPVRDSEQVYKDNHVESYAALVQRMLQKRPPTYKRFPCVATGWDNTARRKKRAYILKGSTPELFEAWLRQVVEQIAPYTAEEDLVFVNAWNEWAEGAHLEPCDRWGRGYLEATRRVIQDTRDRHTRPVLASAGSHQDVSLLRGVIAQTTEHTSTLRAPHATNSERNRSHSAKVTVCIPTCNGARYVAEAMRSVLGQTSADFELLVSDDCSTDSTDAVVKSFGDSRIKYSRNQARLGLVGNWNRCIELAAGDYVCILHQDDVMMPDNLQRKTRVLDDNPTLGMVYSDAFQIDADGNILADHWLPGNPPGDCVRPGADFFRESILGTTNRVNCPSVVARRECYEKLGSFDSRLAFTADWEMWMRIALFYDIGYIAAPLVKYRWHDSNETLRFRDNVQELQEYYACKTAVLEKYPERIHSSAELRARAAEQYAEEALDRALGHYSRGEVHRAEEYLAFALDLRLESGALVPWILKVIDKAWERPADQHFLDMSGEEISQRVPIEKIIIAVCFKIAARPGFGWLRRFEGAAAKLLVR